jgi:hypothetical protein
MIPAEYLTCTSVRSHALQQPEPPYSFQCFLSWTRLNFECVQFCERCRKSNVINFTALTGQVSENHSQQDVCEIEDDRNEGDEVIRAQRVTGSFGGQGQPFKGEPQLIDLSQVHRGTRPMLSDLFKPFIEGSPLSVMMRGLVERLLNPEQMDQWFEQFAQEQYTRELLFSTVVSLMLEVVCGSRKAVNAAYQAMKAAIPVSIQAVYDKLRGVEPAVAAELVRYTAREGQAIIAAIEAALPAPVEAAPAAVLTGGAAVALGVAAHRTESTVPPAPRSPALAQAIKAALAVPPADFVRTGAAVKEERPAVLPGYKVRIVDGNHLAATEHRLKELRTYGGGALPGQALVVYDPDVDMVLNVVPCENGHTQERALLAPLEESVAAGAVWIMDRHFCVLHWFHQIAAKSAYFVVREHEQTPFKPLEPMQEKGATETGLVAEQRIQVLDPNGQPVVWRRIRVLLHKPTRDGDDRIYIWTT